MSTSDAIEPETVRDTLERIFAGMSLRWEIVTMIGSDPAVRIFYPSQEAFIQTCSRTKGGPAPTPEGAAMRIDARVMREFFLAAFPRGKVGFDIDPAGPGSASASDLVAEKPGHAV